MSQTMYVLAVAVAISVMTYITRAIPFHMAPLFKNSKILRSVERYLPGYIIALLVIYEVGADNFTRYPYALPEILALALVVLLQLWKRIMLLSILAGTAAYVLLRVWFGM